MKKKVFICKYLFTLASRSVRLYSEMSEIGKEMSNQTPTQGGREMKALKEYGTVESDEKTIHILQNPYITGDGYRSVGMTDEQIEEAGGLDEINLGVDHHYTIMWDIINPDCEDESEACDWDNPAGVTLV